MTAPTRRAIGPWLARNRWVQDIITGVIIIVAVALDRLRHRRGAGR